MLNITRNFLLASLLVVATAGASDEKPMTQAQLTLDDLRTFTDVFNQIRNNFVEEIDDRELLNAAIRGMLSDLDPHSSYMEADEFKEMDNDFRGRYSGIGVELSLRDGEIKVVFVIPGGAADEAGIVVGDVITAVNGTDLRDKDQQLAINALRGEAGSEVDVTFEHANGEVSTLSLIHI